MTKDVFDRINGYGPDDLEELKARKRNFGVGDRVRCVLQGPFLDCEGIIVRRDTNFYNDPIWTVDFDDSGTVTCMLSHELERVYS